jgi:hypothetical protein
MYRSFRVLYLAASLITLSIGEASLASQNASPFQPDPRTVERYGAGYRYPQAGWIVLHIEGAPYERGYQHGRLMAAEIADFVKCSAGLGSATAPADGWRQTRSLADALFVRRYDREYLEEMRGIADGATDAGARYDGRAIDLVDVVALNSWAEILTLDSALGATPTGLEGIRFPRPGAKRMPAPVEEHCSAFAATGPATADGKIVFGHITMFSLYPSLHYNVWLDLKPAAGHRVAMQTYPAGIQSGMDYYLNDAGLLVSETTLAQTQFNINGMAVGSRIRRALQYSENIDQVADILRTNNNGLYTNEWMIGDTKTNEIAMLELGTAKSKLYRSSRNEWVGGTEGFYWGCNNTKDIDVRLETIPGVKGEPENVVWRPTDRDKTWIRLYREYRGRMGEDFGKIAFTTPPLASAAAVDAKFTTSEMAKELKTWALFGPPLGRAWEPRPNEVKLYPDIRPLASNPWTIIHTVPPTAPELASRPLDLPASVSDSSDKKAAGRPDLTNLVLLPAWHGTILPKTDADTWLASAFAAYERFVSTEQALKRKNEGVLKAADREHLATMLFAARAQYSQGTRAGQERPLDETKSVTGESDWYDAAAGKGVLVLHELRRKMGDKLFLQLMDDFGRSHAGQLVASADFQAAAEKVAGKPLDAFFAYWLRQAGLPRFRIDHVTSVRDNGEYRVQGTIACDNGPADTSIDVTVETSSDEATETFRLSGAASQFSLVVKHRPKRVVVDKYASTARANGGRYGLFGFYSDLNDSLIVYGTTNEEATNRETATLLQKAIARSWPNIYVPIRSDREATSEELKSHHLLLVGRPSTNAVLEQMHDALPIAFGSQSFTVGQDVYAHWRTGVVAAAENPLNARFTIVALSGLSADATLGLPAELTAKIENNCDLLLLPHDGKRTPIAVPAKDLVRDLSELEKEQVRR